ncbi:MAG: DUF2799 domain-containing protein [Betaproteobacteria bacterium]|nr:DUF2799 domain-containing protein [Betaproteobacteria bacterium]MDH3438526.1 DUF2799 domain-containing protein [Betaproteobacteria bacterium]
MAMLDPKRTGLIAAAALALVLQGCASMSKNECLSADWYAIGYESGIRGQREAQISEHRKACAEHSVTPDLARYLEGREAGLQGFCEPRNGYRLGRAGTGYAGVCPPRLEDKFLQAYGAGRELYDMQQNINRLKRRVNAKQAELKNLNEDIADKQAELIAAGTTPSQRVLSLAQLLELQEKAKHIRRDIYYARVQRDRERARLASAERARR